MAEPASGTNDLDQQLTPTTARLADRLRKLAAHALRPGPHRPLLEDLGLAALVLVCHAWLWPRLLDLPKLAFEEYHRRALVSGIGQSPVLLALAVVGSGLLALSASKLRWRALDTTGALRIFVFVTAGVMVWTFATYDYNHFYAQAHLADRGLLVALWLLILAHPAFVFPLLLELQIIVLQVYYPLIEAVWIWPDKRLPFDCLVLFCAFVFVRAVTGARARVFWFLALCLTGASYSHAAIRKMLLGPHLYSWLVDNHLSNIMVSAYANGGWLRFVGDEGIVRLASWLRPLDRPMAAITLAIELSGFLILASRRSTGIVLACFPLLHAAILATTGIFFWKWIVFDLALLWALRRISRTSTAAGDGRNAISPVARGDDPILGPLGGPTGRWLSLAVMAASPLFFYNVAFSWFDSRFVNYFEIHAVGESGQRYRVDPRFFAPYDIIFQQSRFYYLLREPVLVGTYGVTFDYDLVRELEKARPEDVPSLRARFGRTWFHPRAAESFALFVERWMNNAVERRDRPFPPHWLAPPYHFQTSLPANAFDYQELPRSVEIEFVEQLFDGERLVTVSRRPVLSLRLGS